jgi:hypothetical protein
VTSRKMQQFEDIMYQKQKVLRSVIRAGISIRRQS